MKSGATVSDIKSVSAVKKYPRAKTRQNVAKARGRQIWRSIQEYGDDLERLGHISKEARSAITRFVLMTHLTPLEGEAARRFAMIVGRFERFCTETRRHAKSQAYERGFGTDQELERHEVNGTTEDYEAAARDAKKEYEKLMRVLEPYGSQMKSVLDDFCLSDIEPPAGYRENMAIVLGKIGKKFGVTIRQKRKARR